MKKLTIKENGKIISTSMVQPNDNLGNLIQVFLAGHFDPIEHMVIEIEEIKTK